MGPAKTSIVDRSFVRDALARTLAPQVDALAWQTIVARLPSSARPFLFGGVVRNALLSTLTSTSLPCRDVDYVVFGLDNDDDLSVALAAEHPRRNSFGGLKLEIGGVEVDIWRAEREAVIAGDARRLGAPEEFLHCVTLTIDAVLYDPRSATLHEQGFVQALRDRTIEAGRDSRWIAPWIAYHLAHLAYVRDLTGFHVGPRAAARARAAVTPAVVADAVRYLETKGKCLRPRDAVATLLADVGA